MKCRQCEKEFVPSQNQLFCSVRCRAKYNREKGSAGYPSITFNCSKCGRVVVTEGKGDKRTRFCSRQCEKKYWRHPPHDCPATRTNFRSIEEYASWERKTNEI